MERIRRCAGVREFRKVRRQKFFREDEGVVIDSENVVVSEVERPLANRFHLLRVRRVLVAARKKDFVFERRAQLRLRRRSALVRLRDCIPKFCAVEEFVIDALRESGQPCFTLCVDTGLLVETAPAFLNEIVLRLVIDEIIESVARHHSNE